MSDSPYNRAATEVRRLRIAAQRLRLRQPIIVMKQSDPKFTQERLDELESRLAALEAEKGAK